jgi:hypothetical protein
MSDTQMIILVAMPLLGIASNVALFLYIASRVDKLADKVGTLTDRVTRLEEHGPKLVTA